MRKIIIASCLVLLLPAALLAQGFERSAYYKMFKNKNVSTVTLYTSKLEKMDFDGKNAFLGALYMRMAEFEKVPALKLKVFKKGRALLESAINTNPGNSEYRFLRLMIQENAPKSAKYNTRIAEDVSKIKTGINGLDNTTKLEIEDYSKQSTVLKLR